MKEGKCPICDATAKDYGYDATNNRHAYDCDICGRFYLLDMLEHDIDGYKNDENFYKIPSWIYEQNKRFGNTPSLDREKLNDILNYKDKKIKEKFDLAVKFIGDNKIKGELKIQFAVACWIKDDDELLNIVNKLTELDYVRGISVQKILQGSLISIYDPKLTFDGREYLESLDEKSVTSKQVFAAFCFNDDIKEVFDNYVKQAAEECGLTYTRVSSKTTSHDTTINDEIISKIKSSRLIIADFTHQRNSVYFEAGYGMGLKLPIIWTCRKDDVTNLSFDTRQYPHILWENGEDLKLQLINRIKALL